MRIALRAHRIEQRWHKQRTRILDRSIRTVADAPKPTILLGMQVILDRWLVLVYGEGVIQLHDMWDDDSLDPVAEIEWDRAPGSQWSSYGVNLDIASERIIIATARCVPYVIQHLRPSAIAHISSRPYILTIFTLNLAECFEGQGEFMLLKQLFVESPKIVHAISAERGLLAVSTASKVQLVDITSSKASAGNDGVLLETNQDDLVRG